MKRPQDMTDTQLINWLKKTEVSGRNELYGNGQTERYNYTLSIRWYDLANEINSRGIELPDCNPDPDGDIGGGYNWGDATC